MKIQITKYIIAAITFGFILNASAKPSDHDDIVVDENTPDKVLLKGVELSNFKAVKKPSTTLALEIENIDSEIMVRPAKEETQLVVVDATRLEMQEIKSTYAKMSDSENIEIINKSEMKNGSDIK